MVGITPVLSQYGRIAETNQYIPGPQTGTEYVSRPRPNLSIIFPDNNGPKQLLSKSISILLSPKKTIADIRCSTIKA